MAYVAKNGGDWNNYNYILNNNLILNDVEIKWNDSGECINGESLKEWSPIGRFFGVFDGNGYAVSGVYINQAESDNVGFFSAASDDNTHASIKNLSVVNSYVCGKSNVGGIVGNFGARWDDKDSYLQNCTFSGYVRALSEKAGGIMGNGGGGYGGSCSDLFNYGTVQADSYGGGIAGSCYQLTRSYNYGTVSYAKGISESNSDDSGRNFGGITGGSGNCSYCINFGTVSGISAVGGIVGEKDTGTGTISGCENKGIVSGKEKVGGISGASESERLEYCKNSGTVSGERYVGGIVGYRYKGCYPKSYTVTNAYNAGRVSGETYVAGIVGFADDGTYLVSVYNIGTIDSSGISGAILCADNYKWGKTVAYDCFYEKARTPNIFGCGYEGVTGDSGGIQAKTAAELKSIDTYPPEKYSDDGYRYGWNINDKYNRGWILKNDFNNGYPGFVWEYNETIAHPAERISLSKNSLSLEAMETAQLEATVYPNDTFNKNVAWTSDNPTIAAVDENGLVTAYKKGKATITATTVDGTNISDSCLVTVKSTAYITENIADLETPHPYENNCNDVWIYERTEAPYLRITFDAQTTTEENSDYLYIYDGNGKEVGKYTGTELAGKTVYVKGDTVKIKLVSDNAGNAWGFKVTDVKSDGIVYGDLNGDGEISATDVTMTRRFYRGNQELTPEQQECVDVDLNGEITAADVTIIRRYYRGVISEIPVI